MKQKQTMNKKGQIELVVIGGVLLIAILVGGVFVFSESKELYAGDEQSKNVYRYSECKESIDGIPQERLVFFKSLVEAERKGFKLASC